MPVTRDSVRREIHRTINDVRRDPSPRITGYERMRIRTITANVVRVDAALGDERFIGTVVQVISQMAKRNLETCQHISIALARAAEASESVNTVGRVMRGLIHYEDKGPDHGYEAAGFVLWHMSGVRKQKLSPEEVADALAQYRLDRAIQERISGSSYERGKSNKPLQPD